MRKEIRALIFIGEVQNKAFRRRILESAHSHGIAGYIANSQIDNELVFAIFCKEEQALSTFIEVTEEHMSEISVEMKVIREPHLPDFLPIPAARIPNTGDDVDDKFDIALDILNKMSKQLESLKKLDKLEKLDQLDKLEKLDQLDKLEKLNKLDKLDKLDKFEQQLDEICDYIKSG